MHKSTIVRSFAVFVRKFSTEVDYTVQGRNPSFWKSQQTQKQFFDYLSKKLKLKSLEDWYEVKITTVTHEGGAPLLVNNYNSSLFKALSSIYPDHKWKFWKFQSPDVALWADVSNQRAFCDDLYQSLSLQSWEEWYKTRQKTFILHGGQALLDHYNNSYVVALINIYPEYSWEIWRFDSFPLELWKNRENVTKYFDWLENKLSFTSKEEWYNVSDHIIQRNRGNTLLRAHGDSLFEALRFAYPNYNWDVTKVKAAKSEERKMREQSQIIGKALGVKTLDDWYKVSLKDVLRVGGSSIINSTGSVFEVVLKAYPEHDWLPWKFTQLPGGFFNSMANKKKFMDWMYKEKDMKSLDDWYKESANSVVSLGGERIMKFFQYNLPNALKVLYPEHKWDDSLFRYQSKKMPSFELLKQEISEEKKIVDEANKLKQTSQRKKFDSIAELTRQIFQLDEDLLPDQEKRMKEAMSIFFNEVANKLEYKTLQDWYKVSLSDFAKVGAQGVLNRFYSDDYIAALKSVFPDFPWEVSKFEKLPPNSTDNPKHMLNLLESLGKRLHIQTLDDWFSVKKESLNDTPESEIVSRFGLVHLLEKVYKNHNWNRFHKSSVKDLLISTLTELFPEEKIHVDYIHPTASLQDMREFRFDVFIPSKSLAIDILNEHAFIDDLFFGKVARSKQARAAKRLVCRIEKIAFVEIPHWWDGKKESLKASINLVIPDTFDLLSIYKPASKIRRKRSVFNEKVQPGDVE